MPVIDPNQLKLADAYNRLRELYQHPEQNAGLIAKLQAEIKELEGLLNEARRPEGSTYVRELGVFLTPRQKEEWDEAKCRDAESKKKSALGETAPSPLKYSQEDRFLQTQKLGADGWYNTAQVQALTGQKAPVGPAELGNFLAASPKPVSFVYLIEDKKHPEHNHFVSITVDGKGNATWIDSNGDKVPDAERRVLAQYQINYLDTKGNVIPEAKAGTTLLARVQFDQHNCGMYSTSFTNMMRDAAGDPEAIKAGLASIRKIDPLEERRAHTAYLGNEQEIQRGTPYRRAETSLATEARKAGEPARGAGVTSYAQEDRQEITSGHVSSLTTTTNRSSGMVR